MSTYDIIGDIHGRSEELRELLDKLGYKDDGGVYSHPEGRQAIFIGDLINKGPDSQGVLDVVRPMVESGNAQAIMGNHELSVIALSTKKQDGSYIIPHKESVLRQNKGFLDAYPVGTPENEDVISWLSSLPLYIDLPDFRVVHACWDDDSIAVLDTYLEEDHTMGALAMEAYIDRDKTFLQALRTVLTGLSYSLDDDMVYTDFHGKRTKEARILWWASPQDPIEKQIDLRGRPLEPDMVKKLELREKLKMDFMRSSKPTFIGHYYLPGPARELSAKVTGLDYQDQVTAFRWNGAGAKANNEFVEISAKPL